MSPLMDRLWQRTLRPFFFKLDAELAHRIVLTLLSGFPLLRPRPDPEELGQELWGMRFSNPIGLAAGLDKDVRAVGMWQYLGFGFVEVGTITPMPQPGNPRPRLWRLPEHKALINQLGFPSRGMDRAAWRLRRLRARNLTIRVGVNIGPNKLTAPERVAEDIAALAEMISPMADFIVVNVSSPNTPGLREWQAPGQLRALINRAFPRSATTAPGRRTPVLVKIAPDLDSDQLSAICHTALELNLDGIVAVNTTIAREQLNVRSGHRGGLSGQPLKSPARSVIREIYRRTAARLPIIGVGGVASAEDAYEHLRAGASLVELYTGLIYEGPGLPAAIRDGIVSLMRRDGHRSIVEAVGLSATG